MTAGASFWTDVVRVLQMPGMWILLLLVFGLIAAVLHAYFDMGPTHTYVKPAPKATDLAPIAREKAEQIHTAFHRPRTLRAGPRLVGRSSTTQRES